MYITNETFLGLDDEYNSSYNINNYTNVDSNSDICIKFNTALSITMIVALPLFGFAIMIYSIMCLHMYIKIHKKECKNNSLTMLDNEWKHEYEQEKLMRNDNKIRNYGETKFEEIDLT